MKITDELTEVQIKEMEIELLKEKLRYMESENDKLSEQLRLNGVSRSLPSNYDIGLIGDYGGGNVEWWQDYLREEVARCNNYWVSQLQNED